MWVKTYNTVTSLAPPPTPRALDVAVKFSRTCGECVRRTLEVRWAEVFYVFRDCLHDRGVEHLERPVGIGIRRLERVARCFAGRRVQQNAERRQQCHTPLSAIYRRSAGVPSSGKHTEDGERIFIFTSYMRVQKDQKLREKGLE